MAKSPAWQRKEGKNPAGGLNAKGVASYRTANPGSKKLPKAQLGAIVKGVSKISKFFGPAVGATGKSSKIIKPAAKAVKKIKNPRMNSNSDYLKWQAKQIAAGAILAIPPSLALQGAAHYYKNKDNKNRNAVNKNKVKVNTNKIKVKTKKN